MDPLLISIPEAARALAIGRSKIYELMDAGALETVHVGRRRLIRTASIRAYVDTLAKAA